MPDWLKIAEKDRFERCLHDLVDNLKDINMIYCAVCKHTTLAYHPHGDDVHAVCLTCGTYVEVKTEWVKLEKEANHA